MSKKPDYTDPFPNLPRRICGHVMDEKSKHQDRDGHGDLIPVDDGRDGHGENAYDRRQREKRIDDEDHHPPMLSAKDVLADAEKAAKPLSKPKPKKPGEPNKGGRPRTIEGEPWKAVGLSRAAWYRQQKAKL